MANIDLSTLTGQMVVQYYDPSGPAAGDIFFSMATSREGCYIANGADYSQTDDSELYAAYGTAFNTQINPTTGSAWAAPAAGRFRVPDMRGVVARGAGTPHDGTALGVGGYEADQMQGHIHFQDRLAGTISGSTGQNYATGGVGVNNAGQVTTPRNDGVSGAPRTGAETRVKARGGNWFVRRFNPSAVAYGAGLANLLTPGLVYQSDEIDIAAQITCAQAGFVAQSSLVKVEKDKTGKWRMKGNLAGNFTSVNVGAGLAIPVTIAGVVFGPVPQAATNYFGGAASHPNGCFTGASTGGISIQSFNSGATANATGIRISLNVAIDSKPSWA